MVPKTAESGRGEDTVWQGELCKVAEINWQKKRVEKREGGGQIEAGGWRAREGNDIKQQLTRQRQGRAGKGEEKMRKRMGRNGTGHQSSIAIRQAG